MTVPSDPGEVFTTALDRYQAGQPGQAAALFMSVLEQQPDHVDALRLCGLALVRDGQAARALPLLARARTLAPRDPLTHLHHGIGLLEAGRAARATALLRRAAAMLPGDPVPWINLSTAIRALGKPAAARAAARRAIAIAPRSAEARCALGLAERDAGDLTAARTALLAATELAPSFADAWISLGLVQFQLGQIGAATRAMERALGARPGDPVAEANLAGFLLLQGEYESAADRLTALVAREPGCVAARLNLANAMLLDRDAADALTLLAGAPPPGREGAHWRAHRAMALLLLGRDAEAAAELDAIASPFGDAEILIAWRRIVLAERARDAVKADALAMRLAELADDEGASLLEHRIASHFELAAFRTRQRAPADAMHHWTAGHRLLARLQPFSRDAFARFVDASIEHFGAARLRDGPRASTEDASPVFVVGLPRSGTSLIEQILAAHPQVHGAGERSALTRTIAALAGPPLDPATPQTLARLPASSLTSAAERYLADLRGQEIDRRFVVDKMPANALHLGFLATLLPPARVILCRRDPRDIGLSIYQLRFFGYHPYAHDLSDLGWYIGQHERLITHWRATLPIRFIEVGLSDWVSDFPGTLRRVLAFLDLPYDAACERFHQHERRIKTASAEQVRQPINARGIGRWRRWETHLKPMLAEIDACGLFDEARCAPSTLPPF